MEPDKKIPVAILGATGSVGQKFVELLQDHPWFEITALAASERSAGKKYSEVADWFMQNPMPEAVKDMTVSACTPDLPCRIVFSGLDNKVAGDIETKFAEAGYIVVSNAKNHRFSPNVPLLVPEVNGDHLEMVKHQTFEKGAIITNPNCSTVGLCMALKPLVETFGVEKVHVVTLQALSGAGYDGMKNIDITDNIIPHIGGEEEKMATEPAKIFGTLEDNEMVHADMVISAQCNRVNVVDGHTECVSVQLAKPASTEQIIEAWKNFKGEPQELDLPFAPKQPLLYHDDADAPQPKHHRTIENGMTVSIGRLQECPVLGHKFTLLVHNTIRGAAGGAILNAELAIKKGIITT